MSEAIERTIDVDDDPELSRRTWTIQLVGRWLLIAAVVGAVAGLAGHGPLSWTSATAADGHLAVDYERYGRRGGSQTVRVNVARDLAADDRWTVVLSGALARDHELSTITPEPSSMRSTRDGIELTFERVGDVDLTVGISLSPGGMWAETSHVAVPGAGDVTLHQFIYP